MSWAFKTDLFRPEPSETWGWSPEPSRGADSWAYQSGSSGGWSYSTPSSTYDSSWSFHTSSGSSSSWSYSPVSMASSYAFSTQPLSNYGQEGMVNWGQPRTFNCMPEPTGPTSSIFTPVPWFGKR